MERFATSWDLCDSKFLDLNTTWDTHRPRLSACLRDTLLVWTPASVFLLALAIELLAIGQAKRASAKGVIPWSAYNLTRLALVASLALMKLLVFANFVLLIFLPERVLHDTTDRRPSVYYELIDSETTSSRSAREGQTSIRVLVVSALLAPLIQATCHSILALIYGLQRRAGRHTSGPVWMYLLLAVLCGSIDYYALIVSLTSDGDGDGDGDGAQHTTATTTTLERYVNCAHFPLLLLLFAFECRGDTPVLNDAEQERHASGLNNNYSNNNDNNSARRTSPELTASFCSSLSLWWYNKFLWFGYKNKIRIEHLWQTLARDRASELVPKFRSAWVTRKCARALERARAGKRDAAYRLASGQLQPSNSVVRVILKIFWPEYLASLGLKFLHDSIQLVSPLILKRLLNFLSSPNEPTWHGLLFALLFLLVPCVQSFMLNNYFMRVQIIGYNVITMIMGGVYRKALLLSGSSRLQSTSGEIVNLMSVDSERFRNFYLFNSIWTGPVQMLVAIYLLYRELGWSVLAGLACMVLILPLNSYLSKRNSQVSSKAMKQKDERIKHMNEIMAGIKVIKLYAWESSFMGRIFGLRNRELALLKRKFELDTCVEFLWDCCPVIVSCVTFAVYVCVDSANTLDASKAFVSLSLFNVLRFPLTLMPIAINWAIQALVSARRINKFLNNDELVEYVTRNEELDAIAIDGGTLAWTAPSPGDELDGEQGPDDRACGAIGQRPVLRDIDLHVRPESFVAIVGRVASGKSSLLAAILGELHYVAGRFNVCKSMRIAYVPQQAWIQNMSLRDNILFGSDYDELRYNQVLDACALRADLESLPAGDQAEIGERGINLSGGQKQRVSLARACYSNADIYLLDDPLSALDSHVAKHVFERVLSSSTGLLRNKTRVLATNSLFVLPHADQVVALREGEIVEVGAYAELNGNPASYLADIMRQYASTQDDDDDKGKESGDSLMGTRARPGPGAKDTGEPKRDVRAQGHTAGGASAKLIEDEETEESGLSVQHCIKYLRAASWFWALATLVPMCASTALDMATNLWLTVWVSDASDPARAKDAHLRTLRLSVYALLGALCCLGQLAGTIALCQGAMRAARLLHRDLLERVMHSPMSFFDTTPMGRVVNRFSRDIDVIDNALPSTLQYLMAHVLEIISSILIICYSFPSFLLILVPLSFVYAFIQRIFTAGARQLKRLESTTKSPIYANFSETLSGVSTIRAYGCTDRFVAELNTLIDTNQTCSYITILANRWLTVRLQLLGNLITAVAALLAVHYRSTVGAGIAGLAISYCMNITGTLSWLVRQASDLQANLVSVERISEYLENEQEDRWQKEESRPPPGWPSEGALEIVNYSTRYRADLELALRDVSVRIGAREKLGVVGRTGSGKSSLSLALFRIVEPASGAILLDGQNLAHLGLHDIRSRLTIIPQDPILFSGTLRFNLDPLGRCADLDIWRALEQANLRACVDALARGLDFEVTENGENFSLGQRQLICLARAILRKSRVLVLDEATAAVDLQTDNLVQKTIRNVFSECTIITIAHRLHTILDSDRILVLDSGALVELDTPARLLSDESSAFASLVRNAGLDTSSLRATAAAARERDTQDSSDQI